MGDSEACQPVEQSVGTHLNWRLAALEDLACVELEKPISGLDAAECQVLGEAFHREVQSLGQSASDQAARRVFDMLGAVASFHERFSDKSAPFGPMYQDRDGRSAAPQDFRGEPVIVLAQLAAQITHPALRARLADLCWLLERRRAELGRLALASYLQVIELVADGKLKLRHERGEPATSRSVQSLLTRALYIARGLSPNPNTDEALQAKELVVRLRNAAAAPTTPMRLYWFADLDLSFGISPPKEIAEQIERCVGGALSADKFDALELWRLASRAFRLAKQDGDAFRCQREAANTLIQMSQAALSEQQSAMAAASWLSDAISELHGLPDAKELRRNLRHQLVDVQSGIPDEMGSFSHPIDLSDIAKSIRERLQQAPLRDMLFLLAVCERPPSPEKLRQVAEKSLADHPLAGLFSSTYHDDEGKAVHHVDGGFEGDQFAQSVSAAISQHEVIRREIHAFGQVEAARRFINDHYYTGEDTFMRLLSFSPFVPTDLVRTFAIGFVRFFEGDLTSALYVLTPLLENSLRHLLKMHGHDVTVFDDATQLQQDRTISGLFEQMRPELDTILGQALTADIDRVFLSKPGPALRHSVAHGLLGDGSPYSGDAIYACWLIFHLCCMPIWKHRDRIVLD